MIARHETYTDKTDIWTKLAAPLPSGVVSWRQDGKVSARDGRYFARFVAYVDANTVRERLQGVVPGEWDLTLDLLPPLPNGSEEEGNLCSFKARLQILGVIREDVGTGRDYKSAATDAFKRAAVRFGIAHELYAYEQNWVQMDGDGRYAKPLEDPQTAYDRRYGGTGAEGAHANGAGKGRAKGKAASQETPVAVPATAEPVSDRGEVRAAREGAKASAETDSPSCPKCGGRMWDNRLSKRNPKAPDFKCRDRSCDGVVWPARVGGGAGGAAEQPAEPARQSNGAGPLVETDDAHDDADDLPF